MLYLLLNSIFFLYISKPNKIFFVFFILFFKVLTINYSQIYASFFLEDFDKCLIVFDSKISFYKSSSFTEIISTQLLNEQIISSSEEGQMISLGLFNENNHKEIYIIVKNYIYNFVYDGTMNTKLSIDYLKEKISKFIPYKIVYEEEYYYSYFFIAFIDSDKNINIYKYKHKLSNEDFIIEDFNIFNLSTKSNSDSISCQIMKNKDNDNILTCFYEDILTQICALTINVDTLQQLSDLPVKSNNGATYIQSKIFNSGKKAIVCYFSNNNKLACIIFDIIENAWKNEMIYSGIINYSSLVFNFYYFSKADSYLLSWISSSNQFQYIILEEESFNSYSSICISNFTLTINTKKNKNKNISFFSILIYYEDNIYKLLRLYSKNIFTQKLNLNVCTNDKEDIIEEEENADEDEDLESKGNSDNSDSLQTSETLYNLNSLIPSSIFYIPNITTLTTTINDINSLFYLSDNTDKKIINIKINKTLEEITNSLDEIIKKVNNTKIYELSSDDYVVKISPINFADFKESSTYINFLECENTLRIKNNIPSDDILTVAQVEIEKKNNKALTNQVEYEVYYNKKKLDLSVCENDDIEINYEISKMSLLNIELISKFSGLGVDILNNNDEFFNDICYSYSENNSDIILKDRISNFYQNYSVCDENCDYERINLNLSIITCKCSTKTKMELVNKPLRFDSIILDLITNSSFGVIKCYNLVFNFKTKLSNFGFWIFTIIIILHIPLITYYCIYGISPIKRYIINEMKKYNYYIYNNNPMKRKKKKKNKLSLNNNLYQINIYNFKNDLNKNKKYLYTNSNNIDSGKQNIKLNQTDNSSNLNINNKSASMDDKNIFGINNDIKNNDKKQKRKLSLFNKRNTINNDSKNNLGNKKENNIKNEYFLIQINANNSLDNKPPDSKIILDNYDFENALKYDKRSFSTIYYICLLSKENILNILMIKSPLELKCIRLIILIFIYACDFALNTVFYFNDKISDKYNYSGKNIYLFTIFNNIFISLFSSFLSFILVNSLQFLTNSKDNVEELFRKEEKKLRDDNKYTVSRKRKEEILIDIYKINQKLKVKIIVFIIIEFSIILFFYYFVTAFCEVYKKTQISWIIDSFISFILSFPIEFFNAFIISLLYIISIKANIRCLYKVSMVFYSLG